MNDKEITPEKKTFILATVLFLNLILISTNVVLKNERSLFQNIVGIIVSPFQVGFQKTVDFVSERMRRYIFLKDAYKKYSHIKQTQMRLKYENYLLKRRLEDRTFLASLDKMSGEYIAADVISIDVNFPFSSLMINKGANYNLAPGMVVLNGDAELVGKIIEPITFFSARVRLITSSIDGVGAYIRKNKLEGLLKGDNSKICMFKYLVENKPVAVGDEIITSGTDRIFPPYIPIGRVVKIRKKYLLQEVDVKPYFIEKSFKKIIIIKNTDSINE
ncbi:MAG: rod shape-determining protein MreC [Candidatus Aminicenantes bacterium]|nr:rod shape-determining protein MreC [Candidatus Aminicenantes bacterium]